MVPVYKKMNLQTGEGVPYVDTCAWTYDEHHYKWDTACGEAWQFMNDGPKENGVRFCHSCGRPIQTNEEKDGSI